MSPEQKTLVKQTWRTVAPLAESAARLFYSRLFEIDATSRPLFRGVNLKQQRDKLIQALTVVVAAIDDLDAVASSIAELGRRHVRYGVTDGHYTSVGEALIWTLEQMLASAWTPAVRDAWINTYSILAERMRRA